MLIILFRRPFLRAVSVLKQRGWHCGLSVNAVHRCSWIQSLSDRINTMLAHIVFSAARSTCVCSKCVFISMRLIPHRLRLLPANISPTVTLSCQPVWLTVVE